MKEAMRTLSMAQRILAVLAESSLPVSTPDLIAIVATGLSHPESRVHEALGRLKRKGLVTCDRGRARAVRWVMREGRNADDQ